MRDLKDGVWLNEPQAWSLEEGTLAVVTDAGTDFWRETHYGFTRDSGHFSVSAPARLSRPRSACRPATTRSTTRPASWCGSTSAAGSRRGSNCRTAAPCFPAFSPTAARTGRPAPTKATPAISACGRRWPAASCASRSRPTAGCGRWSAWRRFQLADTYRVGPMCCTPERAGLKVRFSEFRLTAPTGKDLHDLS